MIFQGGWSSHPQVSGWLSKGNPTFADPTQDVVFMGPEKRCTSWVDLFQMIWVGYPNLCLVYSGKSHLEIDDLGLAL